MRQLTPLETVGIKSLIDELMNTVLITAIPNLSEYTTSLKQEDGKIIYTLYKEL